jgi:serine phosphatase RsbU (regulator of sigma subunit)/predicted ester cyclase
MRPVGDEQVRRRESLMSTEENKVLVRRFLEAQAKGDLETLDELLAPDFADRSLLPGQEPDREGYLRSVAEIIDVFSNVELTIEDQIAAGDKVATRYTGRSIHRGKFLGAAPTGEEAGYSGIHIHRISGGKILEEWSETDLLTVMLPALEQELRERERIEQELRIARLIQQTLLPKTLPQMPGYHLAAYYQPAREVGGDFYDFLELEDGRLGLVVGDVTDKGVPAALVMATTRTMLRTAAQRLFSPAEVLRLSNEALVTDIPPNMFITCLYAILEPESGRLVYANAGHDLPYRRRASSSSSSGGSEQGGALEVVMAEELRATGMPLGLMPGMSYEEKEIVVAEGESVLFYSDGLVEAHSPEYEMFGFPRLQGLVGAQREGGSSLIGFLLSELSRFVGEGWEQEDDITLVTLQRSEDS